MPASCFVLPGRHRGNAGDHELATAPPACRFTLASSGDATRPPRTPLTLPRPHPLPWISLSLTRMQPSPPTSSPTATAISEPLRRALELRRDAPFLSTEPRPAGSPATVFNLWLPANSSRIRELQSLPGLAVTSTGFVVNPCLFPLSPHARPRLLATMATGAEAHRRPAMSPPWPPSPRAAMERVTMLRALPGARSTHQRLP